MDDYKALQIIPYCLRPLSMPTQTDNEEGYHEDTVWFTFEELRESNVTARQLYYISVPIDLIEEYHVYLDNPETSLSEQIVFKCGGTQFGDMCQYMLEYDESFEDIVINTFNAKATMKQEDGAMLTNLTCYMHLECDRGPAPMCLDWREVCDGKFDCVNGGIDEMGCNELEMNPCDADTYRCHNGAQCIPKTMFNDDPLHPDCLDGSDENIYSTLFEKIVSVCGSNPSFICEDRSCSRMGEFSCGDGVCNKAHFMLSTSHCSSTRSELFRATVFSRGGNAHLTYDCWSSMICLTKIITKEVNCDAHECWAGWTQGCLPLIYQACPSFFLFPSTPVMLGHVYFAYSSNQTYYDRRQGFEFICYNESLCSKFLPPTTKIGALSCLRYEELHLKAYSNSNDLLKALLSIFQACSTVSTGDNNCSMSHLFHCPNSSKCISKHRLVDGTADCFNRLDEDYHMSCSLNQHYRFECLSEKKCLSSIMIEDGMIDCLKGEDEIDEEHRNYETQPIFSMLCDSYQDMLSGLVGDGNETDETDCEPWVCDNLYTRCDGVWNCPNGQDEVNCPGSACQLHEHMCISPETLILTCIPLRKAGDGKVDCLGGTDERMHCRKTYSASIDKRYRCWNDTKCVSTATLCKFTSSSTDEHKCTSSEDQKFCSTEISDDDALYDRLSGICLPQWDSHRTLGEELVCNLTDEYESGVFVKRYPVYLRLRSPDNQSGEQSIKKSISHRLLHDENLEVQSRQFAISYRSVWFCNRGIVIRMSKSRQLRCLCPPSYYGHQCEYQSQRVSLTLQFQQEIQRIVSNVFRFIIMLIDGDNRIHSYEKIMYTVTGNCRDKFNINLLYANRPKNNSAMYNIHIDAYEAVTIQYRASWLLPIRFHFLPLNRLAADLVIPANPSRQCNVPCGNNGQCTLYETTETFFCRCSPGWRGKLCDVKVECDCSSDSVCVGNLNNRSICICPIGKFGPRCYINSPSCRLDSCMNDGLCIPDNERMSHFDYGCICNQFFTGFRCDIPATRIKISFTDIAVPSSVLIHLILAQKDAPPIRISNFQRVSYSQESVTIITTVPFNLLIIEISHIYYLVVAESIAILMKNVSIELSSLKRCLPIQDILNSTILHYRLLRRMKYYHLPCQNKQEMECFYDEQNFCQCTYERQANCFRFDHNKLSDCIGINRCQNGAQCLQDHPRCPTTSTCVCRECFYGNLWQFSTRGLGISIDAVLGYQIQPYIPFFNQPSVVKFSIFLTLVIFIIGSISGTLSIMTFREKASLDVGCGFYLLVEAINSPFIIIGLVLKMVHLLLSQMNVLTNPRLLLVNCFLIDTILNILLTTSSWLTGCVAAERMFTVIIGANVNKTATKTIAKWIIIGVLFVSCLNVVPDLFDRQLFHDEDEHRTWCVTIYSDSWKNFIVVMNFFHFVTPLFINLMSAVVIIFKTARMRSNVQRRRFHIQFRHQCREHKHLLISPLILLILSLPRLLISGCMKSERDSWLFMLSYFLSFVPPILTFPIFVMPSETYTKAFKNSIVRRRVAIQRILNFN
ncbi:unnamed protein product [Rotaria magnacalcarata]|uniref:Uncharacterized protein n=5 Tax=Rotaria magnacalcarata TaxID=392030 RepID=A0A819THT7_9BILA|nr:unnamed protein product [Rotaria magnacalcarata]CAF4065650.1 unnamed protein product [Rotaria magnacalcarata]